MSENLQLWTEPMNVATRLTPPSSERFGALDPNKLRGGYYTPGELADWMCSWAIQTHQDNVLEPSCGDGAFATAAAGRLRDLGADAAGVAKQLQAVEINPEEAASAKQRIASKMGSRRKRWGVHNADFFEWYSAEGSTRFDCVVGNPPFIRYQSFVEPCRTRAMDLMRELGFRPNRLTNSWVPFVAASVALLKSGGRLAMVLPAELLQVTYAGQLRSFLASRFEQIDVVACNELFFSGAEQEVVLLFANGALKADSESQACRMALTEVESVPDLISSTPAEILRRSKPKKVQHDAEKWLKYFLSPIEIDLMRRLREHPDIATLAAHASVDVGVVTGKNSFFVMDQDTADENGINEYLSPVVGRSAQLNGATLSKRDWRSLAEKGGKVHLLDIDGSINGSLSAAGKRYVARGERAGVHRGYKCSIRSQWYVVPSVWVPDAFLFRQIYDFPRMVLNRADATSTDTIHRVRCNLKVRPNELVSSMYSSLTAASAEIEGRSYGGGVLELEPTEAERLLIPRSLGGGLTIKECDQLVRSGQLEQLLVEQDRVLLRDQLGLSARDCKSLRRIWEKMRDRRLRRRRSRRSQ